MNTLSVIIPVFNEKETLSEIIRRVRDISLVGWNKEIIIIDDGSTDGTADLIQALPDEIIKILLPKNSGKGSAVKAGLARASGSYCLIQDADLEYHPRDIPALLTAIKNPGKDVVYGSRNLTGKRYGKFIPRAGVWFITKLINLLFGAKLTDVWTCYKLFPRQAAPLFVVGRFESEIVFTIALAQNGFQILEAPISYLPRDIQHGKKIKYHDGLIAIFIILKMRLKRRPTTSGAEDGV